MIDSSYSGEDIQRALVQLGVGRGDVLFTHSNIGFFGAPRCDSRPESLYAMYKRAIFDVIGQEGTWIVPVFSWSFCRKKVFEVEVTPGECGLLSEWVRKDPDGYREPDANFSVAAIGALAQELTEDPPEHSFGERSFWERFLRHGGKICNFNFDAGSTFIHYVERCLDVSYRYDKAFPGTLIKDGVSYEKVFYHYVYDLAKPQHAPDFRAFDERARGQGAARVAHVGKGSISLISASDTFTLIERALQNDPLFLTIKDQVNKEGFGR